MKTLPFDLNGYTDLPPGKIANVVTYLELRAEDRPEMADLTASIRVNKQRSPTVEWFRTLSTRIGQDWLWTGVALMSDEEVAAVLADRMTDILVAERENGEVGMAEMKSTPTGDTEIVLFGVVPEAVGKGFAAPLMRAALEHAFARGANRVWLHTCTNDHPGAVRFYRKCGFRPYKFAVEIMDDPRLSGRYPEDAAPHIPVIRTTVQPAR